jgi:IclR family transcriptional regulator, KDG regulon repressor
VKILSKAISVLDLFLMSNTELTMEEIAKMAAMNKSTARRIVLSLIDCGFLKRQQKRGKYSLGMKFLDYIQAVKRLNPIVNIAEPYIIEIGRITGETASLALWDGKDAVISRTIYPDNPLRVTANEGTMVGLHFASLGKAIMAEMSEEELSLRLSKNLIKYTHNTITDMNDLKKHLMIVRQEGAAIDDEEAFLGIRGIAAAFKNNEKIVVGVVNILGPSVRLTREKIREYIPAVKECASKISNALGYHEKQ